MGNVANVLLFIGETNVHSNTSDSVTITPQLTNDDSKQRSLSAPQPTCDHIDNTKPECTDSTSLSLSSEHVENRNIPLNNSFEKAMASAKELQEKWMLTFEQFVSALQKEPVLCQFFAEQNCIDLSGTNVDPVLDPYTRTTLAASP